AFVAGSWATAAPRQPAPERRVTAPAPLPPCTPRPPAPSTGVFWLSGTESGGEVGGSLRGRDQQQVRPVSFLSATPLPPHLREFTALAREKVQLSGPESCLPSHTPSCKGSGRRGELSNGALHQRSFGDRAFGDNEAKIKG
uniref:Uncharacterized protein n=1 Tax=Mustela putorius furo TaxID=9669 RepID=M3XWB4_MUSPF